MDLLKLLELFEILELLEVLQLSRFEVLLAFNRAHTLIVFRFVGLNKVRAKNTNTQEMTR